MNWMKLLPIAKAVGIAALGAMGMIGVQNTVPVVKQATTATPQVIQVECPKFEVVIPRGKYVRD